MDAQALIAVVALLAVVAAAVVVVVVLERRRREAVPPLDQAEVVRQAVADALGSLRADTGEHVQQAVHTLMALAGDTLDGRLQAGQTHIDHRNEQISAQLEGLQAELRRVNTTVETLQREKAEQHGALVSGLEETIRQSQSVARTTQSLREALSSTKARGQWGERLADDVLRLAGFVEGVSYRRQVATSVGSVPDFTFPLPGGLVLHMDVKFPFDNYVRYLEAGGGADGQPQLNQFLRDARSRVKELGGRGYIRPGETLDYVLLFIPNEAVYGFLHEHDPALADFALGQRVVLCSPFTLFAVLSVVRQAVDSFTLQRSTDEILTALGAFGTQWEKFSDAIDTVGKRLESASRAYEELSGPRRRQLQRMVDRVDDLRSARDTPEVAERSPAGRIGPLRAPAGGASEVVEVAAVRDLARRAG